MARARWVLAALLVLTLLLKVVTGGPSPVPDAGAGAAALDRMLDEAGFDAKIVSLHRSPKVVVSARRGNCRLVGGDYLPHGTFADAYSALARPVGPLSYAYRGSLHRRAPRIRALFDFYAWRELRRIGFRPGRPAIFAIAVGPGCDAGRLPWQKVAKVSDRERRTGAAQQRERG